MVDKGVARRIGVDAAHPAPHGDGEARGDTDSWQRHLDKPELQRRPDATFALVRPGAQLGRVPAWIYVFDIDVASHSSPSPLRVKRVIATDAESISYFAVTVAPEAAIASGGSSELLLASIRRRLVRFRPALAAAGGQDTWLPRHVTRAT